jgi:hypothetical protein
MNVFESSDNDWSSRGLNKESWQLLPKRRNRIFYNG